MSRKWSAAKKKKEKKKEKTRWPTEPEFNFSSSNYFVLGLSKCITSVKRIDPFFFHAIL